MFSKKVFLMIALFVVLATAPVFAGNYGGFNRTLPVYNICSGAAEVIVGTVVNYGIPGNGLELKVGDTIVNVYGIGPYWYWERQGIEMPEIGETVTATVSKITTADVKVLIKLATGAEEIQLRDPNTCQPLWRALRAVK